MAAILPQLPGLPFLVPSISPCLALEKQLLWHPCDLIIAFLEDFSLRFVGSGIRDESDGDDDVHVCSCVNLCMSTVVYMCVYVHVCALEGRAGFLGLYGLEG